MSFPVTWKFVGKALPSCCTAAAQTFPQHIRAPGPAQHLVPSAFCFPSPDVSMTQSSAGMRASSRRAREKKVGPCFFQHAYTRPGGCPSWKTTNRKRQQELRPRGSSRAWVRCHTRDGARPLASLGAVPCIPAEPLARCSSPSPYVPLAHNLRHATPSLRRGGEGREKGDELIQKLLAARRNKIKAEVT